ncbi:hypothetical protein BH10ACT8_BH10ACT8_21570 [soil metagenome]
MSNPMDRDRLEGGPGYPPAPAYPRDGSDQAPPVGDPLGAGHVDAGHSGTGHPGTGHSDTDQSDAGPDSRFGNEPARSPGSGDEPAVPPATPAPSQAAPGFDHKGHVRRTRVSGVWMGLIGTALFLILLIIFIAQNSRTVSIHFFGWRGQFSLALTIVLSAVIGVLLVAIPGSVRIFQLRRALRKNVPGGKIS